jgi:phage antirepressor YoqD-like protein
MLAAKQAEQIEHQQTLLEQQQHAVDFVDSFVDTDTTHSVRDTSKLLGVTEKVLKEWLYGSGILFRNANGIGIPKANLQAKGYFTVKTLLKNGDNRLQTRITAKGVKWLSKMMCSTNE